jgi:hypothetical protein
MLRASRADPVEGEVIDLSPLAPLFAGIWGAVALVPGLAALAILIFSLSSLHEGGGLGLIFAWVFGLLSYLCARAGWDCWTVKRRLVFGWDCVQYWIGNALQWEAGYADIADAFLLKRGWLPRGTYLRVRVIARPDNGPATAGASPGAAAGVERVVRLPHLAESPERCLEALLRCQRRFQLERVLPPRS